MKRSPELKNKVSVLQREMDGLRASAQQDKDDLQQLHELLAPREKVHKKELGEKIGRHQEAVRRAGG